MESSSMNTEKRTPLLLRGVRLEYFTVGYVLLEGLIAAGAGLVAGSIDLVRVSRTRSPRLPRKSS